jgi:prepilin-type N-terminal cleavage/methylation domain-containing protein
MPAIRRQSRYPRGFTLLELIVANVIAVILLGAVAVVLRTVNHSQQQFRAGEALANPAREGIVSLVRHDLANSRRIWQYPDGSGVVLTGYAGLSPATYGPTGDLCRVYYRVSHGVLLRVQESLDESAVQPSWSGMVCSGVTAFSLTTVPDPELSPEPEPANPREGLRLTRRVTLTIQLREPSQSLREDLWLR